MQGVPLALLRRIALLQLAAALNASSPHECCSAMNSMVTACRAAVATQPHALKAAQQLRSFTWAVCHSKEAVTTQWAGTVHAFSTMIHLCGDSADVTFVCSPCVWFCPILRALEGQQACCQAAMEQLLVAGNSCAAAAWRGSALCHTTDGEALFCNGHWHWANASHDAA
jgi:hypothetical protein